ncbi:MAG: YggT family protein [Deltaproteobacteria bacterium]|jgi:YggT family protein|nr:YggT family protein [Deltaproteobacteria bacterium]
MIKTIGTVLWLLITIYGWILLLRLLVSWFTPNPHSPFMVRLRQITDPPLAYARRLCPLSLGGLDFSPVILLIALYFLASFVRLGSLALDAGAAIGVLLPVFVICLLYLVQNVVMLILIFMVCRAVLSLVKPNPYNPLALIVFGATEPLLAPLRNLFPKGPWGLDLRAVLFVAFLLIFYAVLLQRFLEMSVVWMHSFGISPVG